MLVSFLGIRGTIPTINSPTVSFLVNNKILFEPTAELIQSFQKYAFEWKQFINNPANNLYVSKYPIPSLAKLDYVVISHLHWDHWGGLRHLLHYLVLANNEGKKEAKTQILVPQGSADFLVENLATIFGVDRSVFPKNSAKILEFWLVAELGSGILDVVEFIELSPENSPYQLDKFTSLSCCYNDHLRGSLCLRIDETKSKLDVEKARTLGVPFNASLSDLQNGKILRINDRDISYSDVFYEQHIGLGYSGDTAVDNRFISFFHNVNVLIHDSTYLQRDANYHLDSHSALPDVLKFAVQLTPELGTVIPIHFSYRYTDDEIDKALNEIQKSYVNTFQILRVHPGGTYHLDLATKQFIPLF